MRSRTIQKDVLGIELERASASTRGVDGDEAWETFAEAANAPEGCVRCKLERASASTRGVDGRGLGDVRGGPRTHQKDVLGVELERASASTRGVDGDEALETFAEARERTRMLIARIRLNG